MGRVEDVPEKAISEVRATTSQVSSGSVFAARESSTCLQAIGGK